MLGNDTFTMATSTPMILMLIYIDDEGRLDVPIAIETAREIKKPLLPIQMGTQSQDGDVLYECPRVSLPFCCAGLDGDHCGEVGL